MRFILFVPLLLLPLTLASASTQSITLPGYAHHEVCVTPRLGESLRYRFNSSAALDFNIHYHLAGETHYPRKLTQQQEASGVYPVEVAVRHCLMWSNRGSQPIAVEAHLE